MAASRFQNTSELQYREILCLCFYLMMCLMCLQVTVEYRNDNGACIPLRVHTVVVSVQHSPDITLPEMRKQIKEHIIEVYIAVDFIQFAFPT